MGHVSAGFSDFFGTRSSSGEEVISNIVEVLSPEKSVHHQGSLVPLLVLFWEAFRHLPSAVASFAPEDCFHYRALSLICQVRRRACGMEPPQ